VDGKTPEKAGTVSPEKETPLYTQSQLDALVQSGRSELGRKLKAVEVERDTIKTKNSELETNIEDIQGERDSLETEIEELAKGDPRKFDLVKKDKELRQKERDLKGKLTDVESRESVLNEKEKKINSSNMESLMGTVAGEYDDGDKTRLGKMVSTYDNPSEEKVREIAAIMFTRKAGSPKLPTPNAYKGITDGGTDGLDNLNPKQLLHKAYAPKR